MKEQILISELRKVGLEFVSWREIGDSFQEWVFEPQEGCDMRAAFRAMRQYDFWEIVIDRPEGEQVTASRVMY